MAQESHEPSRDGSTEDGPRWQRIGVDRILREPDGLTVETASAMPEWRASHFRPTAVIFLGERFVVRSHTVEPAERSGRHVYELTPWPDDGVEPPGAVIEYDEEYVRARQRRRSVVRVADVFEVLAVLLTPLIGFLPSRAKAALHGSVGVHPITATRASILLEIVFMFLCCAFAMIYIMTMGMATSELVHSLWLVPLLGLDTFMRYAAVLRDEMYPPGFLEWLIPARVRQPHGEGDSQRD